MKKIIKVGLISALALTSFIEFSATNVQASAVPDYVHTYKVERVLAKGNQDMNGTDLFNFSLVTNRALGANTDWKFDQTAFNNSNVSGNKTMLRVATNEWVSKQNVATVYNTENGDTQGTKEPTKIYSLDYKTYSMNDTGKILPIGLWKSGKIIDMPDGVSYTQIATNEWIPVVGA